MLLVALAACMWGPHDQQQIPSTTSPVEFWGFHLNPSTDVHVQARDPVTGAWKTLVTARSDPGSFATTKDGHDMYYWSVTRVIGPEFWEPIGGGGSARVRARDSANFLVSVRADSGSCYWQTATLGEFFLKCTAPGNPEATVIAKQYAPEPPALRGITDAHNVVRAAHGLDPLEWDPQLAQIAQAWANTCTNKDSDPSLLDHNENRSNSYPGYVGENIYASTGTPTPQEAVNWWVGEKQWYHYSNNTCSAPPNESCSHYTQVVWADTERVGCGVSTCPGITLRNSIVCNYSPGGNTGGRPY
jgi:hypothetical protein